MVDLKDVKDVGCLNFLNFLCNIIFGYDFWLFNFNVLRIIFIGGFIRIRFIIVRDVVKMY